MLNQAPGDRQILAKKLNISPHQLSYVTQANEGEGLLFYGCLLYTSNWPRLSGDGNPISTSCRNMRTFAMSY